MATRIPLALVFVLLIAGGTTQAAPIVGTTATGVMSAPCCGTIFGGVETVVDPGFEFVFNGFGGSIFGADLSDSTINLGLFTGDTGLIGDDITWSFILDPAISVISVAEISDNFVNGASLVSFSGNTLSFQILDQFHSSGQAFNAVYSIVATQVPVPATLVLLSVGLAGFAHTRRKSR